FFSFLEQVEIELFFDFLLAFYFEQPALFAGHGSDFAQQQLLPAVEFFIGGEGAFFYFRQRFEYGFFDGQKLIVKPFECGVVDLSGSFQRFDRQQQFIVARQKSFQFQVVHFDVVRNQLGQFLVFVDVVGDHVEPFDFQAVVNDDFFVGFYFGINFLDFGFHARDDVVAHHVIFHVFFYRRQFIGEVLEPVVDKLLGLLDGLIFSFYAFVGISLYERVEN